MEDKPETALKYLGKRHEYGDVYTFIFAPLEPVPFLAGQYAHVRVPGVKEGKAVREFSFASAPSDAEIWFTVHVRQGSPYKTRLQELLPGDTVTLFKIKGDFTYSESEKREVVCIAGGIGITPFRSIVREREALGFALPAVLIHVASDGYLFQEELQTMPMEQHRITRSEADATLGDVVSRKPDALYYVAGSPYFTVMTEALLEKLGIPAEHIKRDDFDGYEGEA
jgi:ferredoxin-NADP reductase